ncbi:MAG: methyltransferase domain-containing protein [Spirochaetes bacterium]|nr:methyltransferase domain-containing protein [Spirochaetota bacterium]
MNTKSNIIEAINIRYSNLAHSSCCLSCGGAINHAHPQPGEVCVDLGSGRGTDVLRMADEVGNNGYVYGIDISTGMIAKSRELSDKFGYTNVAFIQSDLETLPLPENNCDVIISNCTINHVNNKQKVFNEIYRILKPGGRCIISDIYSIGQVPLEYKNDPDAVAECWAGSIPKDEYLAIIAQAGFPEIVILEESEPYPKGAIYVASFTYKIVKPQ